MEVSLAIVFLRHGDVEDTHVRVASYLTGTRKKSRRAETLSGRGRGGKGKGLKHGGKQRDKVLLPQLGSLSLSVSQSASDWVS